MAHEATFSGGSSVGASGGRHVRIDSFRTTLSSESLSLLEQGGVARMSGSDELEPSPSSTPTSLAQPLFDRRSSDDAFAEGDESAVAAAAADRAFVARFHVSSVSRASTDASQPRGRPRSASTAGAIVRRVTVTPPASSLVGGGSGGVGGVHGVTRTTRSMSDSRLDDDDSEAHRLLPSSRLSLGASLRRRDSFVCVPPAALPQALLQEPLEWGGRSTSRILVLCASGVLFLLLFLFCSVLGLRLAARARYDARCDTSALSADDDGDLSFGWSSKWVPSYDRAEWDHKWFETHARRKFARELAPIPVTTNDDEDTVKDERAQSVENKVSTAWNAAEGLAALRINHFKMMGTHNSYHLPSSLPLSMHQYSHASLPRQLHTYRHGIRQLELDIHIVPGKDDDKSTTSSSSSSSATSTPAAGADASQPTSSSTQVASDSDSDNGGGLVVYHLQWLDDRTSCYCLSQCLSLVSKWSATHPAHFPLVIAFEIKSQLWEDVDTGLRGVTCADVRAVEAEVLRAFSRERLITPLEVRGGNSKKKGAEKFTTVKDALNEAARREQAFRDLTLARRTAGELGPSVSEFPEFEFGWPKLNEALGRVMLVWLDDVHNLADHLDCVVAPPDDLTAHDDSSLSASSGDKDAEAVAEEKARREATAAASNPAFYHADERLIFIAQNSFDKPYASVITQNRALEAARVGTIAHAAVKHGYMVRTMSVESSDGLPHRRRFAASLASGAHMISTDFEECVVRTEFNADDAGFAGEVVVAEPALVYGEDASLHAVAAAHEAGRLPSVLPSPTNEVVHTNGTLYCEQLTPAAWPFECNSVTAPHFCDGALDTARMLMELRDAKK